MRLTLCRPAVPPVTVFGCAFGSATNGIWNAALGAPVLIEVKSRPLLLYWFESHTYGVRPVKYPTPPRTCDRKAAPLLRSQLKPIRGDHINGAGTTSVAYPKSVTVTGFARGLSGKWGASRRTPYVSVRLDLARHWSPT